MDKLEIVKFAASTVVSIGVGAVFGNAVKFTTPVDTTLIQKISVGIGSAVIGSMISNAATTYVKTKIDEAATAINPESTTEEVTEEPTE